MRRAMRARRHQGFWKSGQERTKQCSSHQPGRTGESSAKPATLTRARGAGWQETDKATRFHFAPPFLSTSCRAAGCRLEMGSGENFLCEPSSGREDIHCRGGDGIFSRPCFHKVVESAVAHQLLVGNEVHDADGRAGIRVGDADQHPLDELIALRPGGMV